MVTQLVPMLSMRDTCGERTRGLHSGTWLTLQHLPNLNHMIQGQIPDILESDEIRGNNRLED